MTTEWVRANADRCHVARDILAHQRRVSHEELCALQDALYDWRKVLALRLPEGELGFLVVRHGCVLIGALNGAEVPASEDITRFAEPVSGR